MITIANLLVNLLMKGCEKFHQVDMKTIITLIQPKTTYYLSTFRLHVGSLHRD